jgi:hypothetical protein
MNSAKLFPWLLTLSVCGALLGGVVAYAQRMECLESYGCGSNSDGSTMVCYRAISCP